jgi:hypothetical protein
VQPVALCSSCNSCKRHDLPQRSHNFVIHCTKTPEQNVYVFIDHYTIEDLAVTLQRRKLAGITFKDPVRTAQ